MACDQVLKQRVHKGDNELKLIAKSIFLFYMELREKVRAQDTAEHQEVSASQTQRAESSCGCSAGTLSIIVGESVLASLTGEAKEATLQGHSLLTSEHQAM